MSWLGGKRVANDVLAALALGDATRVLVAFDSKLAARLAAAGLDVSFTSDVERDLTRATTPTVDFPSSPAPRAFGAAIAVGAIARDDGGSATISLMMETVSSGGRLALIDRVARPVASRAALVGGLSQLEQVTSGRYVITTGTVIAV